MTRKGVIGKNNALPWNLPDDLKRFRRITAGKPVIMGRKTFESIGRPLPQRQNIVISRNPHYVLPLGVIGVTSLEEALACEDIQQAPEVFVIGGSEIFRQALPHVQKLYITWIDEDFAGDVLFPTFDVAQYRVDSEEEFKEPFAYRFVDYSALHPSP